MTARLLAAALLAAAPSVVPHWTITDLGTLPGQANGYLEAKALNARGDVVVTNMTNGAANVHETAFVWHDGKRIALGYPKVVWVDAAAINDRGDVAGQADTGLPPFSVLWRGGKPVKLGNGGYPIAVNAHDVVAGNEGKDGGAWIWKGGRLTELGPRTTAVALNDAGEVAGYAVPADGRTHAFLWRDGTLTDLGSDAGLASFATGINNSGTVAGFLAMGSGIPIEAVEWRNGVLRRLGRFGSAASEAVGINDSGHVLVELTNATGVGRGAVLLRDGKAIRVGGAEDGWLGPNAKDEVAGYGLTPNGGRRTFVWRNGRTTLLPTFDDATPPWGAPARLNDAGDVIGTSYVTRAGHNVQHAVLWRPKR